MQKTKNVIFSPAWTKEGDGDARAAHDPAGRASGGHALAPARMR